MIFRSHILISYKYGTLVLRNINFYCTLKIDIVLGACAECHIYFIICLLLILAENLYLTSEGQ